MPLLGRQLLLAESSRSLLLWLLLELFQRPQGWLSGDEQKVVGTSGHLQHCAPTRLGREVRARRRGDGD